jgi:hypothetical protein
MDEPYDDDAPLCEYTNCTAIATTTVGGKDLCGVHADEFQEDRTETGDAVPMMVPDEVITPEHESDDVEMAVIKRLKLNPEDVLTLVVPEKVSEAHPMAQISENVSTALASRGLNNLVLVFPHGTEIGKVKLTKKQVRELASQGAPLTSVGVEEDTTPIQRSAFGGFSR